MPPIEPSNVSFFAQKRLPLVSAHNMKDVPENTDVFATTREQAHQ
jgi:hypothetical protein